jgi:hypothetical protein
MAGDSDVGIYDVVDEPFPMWRQCVEPFGGAFAELPEGAAVGVPSGGGAVGVPLGDSPAAGVEPVGEDVDVGEDEALVAALATAAPPPTSRPASPTPASVCRSRIFNSFTSFSGIGCRRHH